MQLEPQQWDEGQASRAGHAAAPPPETWPDGALMRRSNRRRPHFGHAGFSSPRTNSSNSCPHSKHAYS